MLGEKLDRTGLVVWMCNNGVTQLALAEYLGVVHSTITHWLSGYTNMPLWAALKLSELSGKSVNELFSLE